MYFPEIAVQVQVHPSSRCFLQVFPGILSECFSPKLKLLVHTSLCTHPCDSSTEVFFFWRFSSEGGHESDLQTNPIKESLPANSPMVFKKSLSREVKCGLSSKTSHPAAKHPYIFSLGAFISLELRFFFG